MNILDRLLQNIYYEGQKRFSPEMSEPITAPRKTPLPLAQGVGISSPSDTTQSSQSSQLPSAQQEDSKDINPMSMAPKVEPWIPTTDVTPALQEAANAEALKSKTISANRQRILADFQSSFPEEQAKPSFWGKIFTPIVGGLSWVEKIDATTYGFVRGYISSILKGTTLNEEFGLDKKDISIWQASQDYTHSLNSYEQFFGELIISPFNLIPANAIFGGTAKGIGRMSSFIARTQVEGATNLSGKIATKVLGYTPSGLRARVSGRTAEYFVEILGAKNIVQKTAMQEFPSHEGWGVARRIKALAEGDIKYLSTLYPEAHVSAWLAKAETKEVRAYLNKAVSSKSIKWADYEIPIGFGMERTAQQVEADIFYSVQRSASPLTKGMVGGGLGNTGIITGIVNPFYNFSRFAVRQMTPFLLLTRPAFTTYNQMTNFYMLMERHGMDSLKFLLNPKMKGIRPADFWGIVDAPVMVREGMGYNYMAAIDAMEHGEELVEAAGKTVASNKTLPLFGTGSFFRSVNELRKMYKNIPATQRPFIERIIPKLQSYDALVRGVNVAGEQYFRSATFYFTHRKTYDKLMDNWLKGMGVNNPGLITLAKSGKLAEFSSQPINLSVGEMPDFAGKGFWKAPEINEPLWRAQGDEPSLRPSKAYAPEVEGAYTENPLDIRPTNIQVTQHQVQIKHPLIATDQFGLVEKWAAQGDKVAQELQTKVLKMSHAGRGSEWFVEADTYIAQKAGSMGFDGLVYSYTSAGESASWIKKGVKGHEYVLIDPNLVKERKWFTPKDFMDLEGLPPSTKASLELMASELGEAHSIEDIINLFDKQTMAMGEASKSQKMFGKLHGDAKSMNEVTGDLAGDLTKQTELDKELTSNLAEASPQQKKFLAKVNSREWAKIDKEIDEILAPHTPEEQALRDRMRQVDAGFRERNLLLDTKYHLEVESYKDFAKKKGSKVLQKDVQHIYDKLYTAKMDNYDFWYLKKKKIADDIKQIKADNGGVLKLADLDDYFVKQTKEIEEVLKFHGFPDSMLGKSPLEVDELIDEFTAKTIEDLQKAKTQTLLNWNEKVNLKFPEHLADVDVQMFHNEAMSYAYREAVRTMENDYFNYSTRNNIDWLMSTLSPYPFWQSRFCVHFATRCLDNPKQMNAFILLVKKWSDSTKDLPSFLMSSPISLSLPDGGEVRFSPYQFFFPLGYGISSIERYSDQANDAVDAIAQIQDMVGGYLMPYWEIAASLVGNNLGLPVTKSRGTGLARQPVEVIKDIVPQLKLLREFMSVNSHTTKWAVDHGLTTEGEQAQVVRTIGDALNSGELTNQVEAQEAIDSIYDGNPNALALKYWSKTLGRKATSDIPRYAGLPLSYWASDSKKTWAVQQILYPEEGDLLAPDAQKELLKQYPGLDIVRGNIVPAGLDVKQEKRWKAAREYYVLVDKAKESRDSQLTKLQQRFDNPEIGATVTGAEYRSQRTNILQQFYGSIDTASMRASELGAPITREQRDAFWKEVGRKVYPRHPLEDVVEEYYRIEAQDYEMPDGSMDWDSYFRDRKSYMDNLAPWIKSWLEKYLTDPTRPDADYIKTQKIVEKYWNVKSALLLKYPDVQYIVDNIEYWSKENPAMADIFKKQPIYRRYNKTLELIHKSLRTESRELDSALVKYWGYKPIWKKTTPTNPSSEGAPNSVGEEI